VCAVFLLAPADPARAQAWVPPAGSGSVTVASQTIDNTGHLLTDGSLLPDGKSRNASLYFEVEYAITNRLAVSAGLPLVFARYIGPNPAPGPPQAVDLCRCWQSAWQDFGFTARYAVASGSVAVTPSVSLGVPSHAYDYRGEAVVGRRLREARFGLAVGRRLDAVSPKLSVQGTYTYAVVERVAGLANNRSNANIQVAWLASRKLSARGFATVQRTHGGLRAGTAPPPLEGFPWGEITSSDLFAQHDRLLRDNSLHLGGGLSYSLPRIDLFGSFVKYVRGTDTHAGHVLTAGVSWPFEWRIARRTR
jgi:hypothetical protein